MQPSATQTVRIVGIEERVCVCLCVCVCGGGGGEWYKLEIIILEKKRPPSPYLYEIFALLLATTERQVHSFLSSFSFEKNSLSLYGWKKGKLPKLCKLFLDCPVKKPSFFCFLSNPLCVFVSHLEVDWVQNTN